MLLLSCAESKHVNMSNKRKRASDRGSWDPTKEDRLVELWHGHECLYNVSAETYHDRNKKDAAWRDVAEALQLPVREVQTRTSSLRTQYGKILRPKPSGSATKDLTPRQKWIFRNLDFLKPYVLSRQACGTPDLDQTSSAHTTEPTVEDEEELDDEEAPEEDPASPTSSLHDSSLPTSRPPSPRISSEATSDSSTPESTSRPVERTPPPRTSFQRSRRKPRGKGEEADKLEREKISILKQVASSVLCTSEDSHEIFGRQIASEMRLIEDPAVIRQLRRSITNMLYDAQERAMSGPCLQHSPVPPAQPLCSPYGEQAAAAPFSQPPADTEPRPPSPPPSPTSFTKRKQQAVGLTTAVFCLEKPKKKRVWTRSWLGRRGQHGLAILQSELEADGKSGFRDLLHMNVEEFDLLLGLVAPCITKRHTQLRRAITARERLSLTLKFLATGESFASLSIQYCTGRSTVSKIVEETCDALYHVLKDEYMKTPTTEAEWRKVARIFEEKCQFPHCLGAIDGKLINIFPPGKNGSTFSKSRFPILLTAVVDAQYKFLYAHVGTQRSVSDAGPFAHSDLQAAMDRQLPTVPPPELLPGTTVEMPFMFVGDEAYPLHTELMTPYASQDLDHDQCVYNYRLSRARRSGENAFGVLASRWRVFHSTINLDPVRVSKVTLAALALHNFLRVKAADVYLPPALVDGEDDKHQIIPGTWRNDAPLHSATASQATNASANAREQRDQLKAYFVSAAGLVPWQECMVL